MELKRTAENDLLEWKAGINRKPLIIRGARQVGKTTLVRRFARDFKHFIELNLEREKDLIFFEGFIDVRTLTEALFLQRKIPLSDMSDTLIFIDEIQESPDAISKLRFFYEDLPALYVIAAGSLLEFSMKKIRNFPVARVSYLYLHPLNFYEFLMALDHEIALEQLVNIPVNNSAHPVLLELFNQYLIIGGMPEVVSAYVENNTTTFLPRIYDSILSTYKEDIEKYASNETERKVLRHIVEVAGAYIDKRIKFQNFGESGYRSREVGEAFEILNKAKYLRLIHPSTSMEIPILTDHKKAPRIQFLDTGLLNYDLNIQSELLPVENLSFAYKGALIPQILYQEITSLNNKGDKLPNFWVREKKQSSAEVDIILASGGKVIPVEIKSGKDGTLKSLHQFVDAANHPYAVRIYGGEFKVNSTRTPAGKAYFLLNLPYYCGTQLYKYIYWFLKEYPE